MFLIKIQKLAILTALVLFSLVAKSQSPLFYAHFTIQNIVLSGSDATITVSNFQAGKKQFPVLAYEITDLPQSTSVWVGCKRFSVLSVSGTQILVSDPQNTLGATNYVGQRASAMRETFYENTPIGGFSSAVLTNLSNMNELQASCMSSFYDSNLKSVLNTAKEVMKYIGISGVLPASPPDPSSLTIAQNSAGQLSVWNGIAWQFVSTPATTNVLSSVKVATGTQFNSNVNGVLSTTIDLFQTATQTPSNAIVASPTQIAVPSTNLQGAISDLATEAKLGQNDWKLDGNTNGAVKNIGTKDAFDLPFITNNTEKLRILSNGNVGIGTIAPAMKFHVRSEGSIAMFGYNGGGANNPYLVLGAEEIGNLSIINANGSIGGGSLVFKSAANETMRILPNGNVGVGTTAPTCKLGIAGTDAIKIPLGTTSQRPVISANGMQRYNSTLNNFEKYVNGAWVQDAISTVSQYKEFTATAAQTSFTLPTTPFTGSEVIMFRNGVSQSTTTYTVTGTTVTYTGTSLVAGDRVNFSYTK